MEFKNGMNCSERAKMVNVLPNNIVYKVTFEGKQQQQQNNLLDYQQLLDGHCEEYHTISLLSRDDCNYHRRNLIRTKIMQPVIQEFGGKFWINENNGTNVDGSDSTSGWKLANGFEIMIILASELQHRCLVKQQQQQQQQQTQLSNFQQLPPPQQQRRRLEEQQQRHNHHQEKEKIVTEEEVRHHLQECYEATQKPDKKWNNVDLDVPCDDGMPVYAITTTQGADATTKEVSSNNEKFVFLGTRDGNNLLYKRLLRENVKAFQKVPPRDIDQAIFVTLKIIIPIFENGGSFFIRNPREKTSWIFADGEAIVKQTVSDLRTRYQKSETLSKLAPKHDGNDNKENGDSTVLTSAAMADLKKKNKIFAMEFNHEGIITQTSKDEFGVAVTANNDTPLKPGFGSKVEKATKIQKELVNDKAAFNILETRPGPKAINETIQQNIDPDVEKIVGIPTVITATITTNDSPPAAFSGKKLGSEGGVYSVLRNDIDTDGNEDDSEVDVFYETGDNKGFNAASTGNDEGCDSDFQGDDSFVDIFKRANVDNEPERELRLVGLTAKDETISNSNDKAVSTVILPGNDKTKIRARETPGVPLFAEHHVDLWALRLEEATEYRQKHGHCNIPCEYPENQVLANWAKRQRYQYNLFHSKTKSTLTVERIRALDKIGFCWGKGTVAWFTKFEELESYLKQKGESPFTSSLQKTNPKLSSWVKCQRKQYTLFKSGLQSRMTKMRAELFDSLGPKWYSAKAGSTRDIELLRNGEILKLREEIKNEQGGNKTSKRQHRTEIESRNERPMKRKRSKESLRPYAGCCKSRNDTVDYVYDQRMASAKDGEKDLSADSKSNCPSNVRPAALKEFPPLELPDHVESTAPDSNLTGSRIEDFTPNTLPVEANCPINTNRLMAIREDKPDKKAVNPSYPFVPTCPFGSIYGTGASGTNLHSPSYHQQVENDEVQVLKRRIRIADNALQNGNVDTDTENELRERKKRLIGEYLNLLTL